MHSLITNSIRNDFCLWSQFTSSARHISWKPEPEEMLAEHTEYGKKRNKYFGFIAVLAIFTNLDNSQNVSTFKDKIIINDNFLKSLPRRSLLF